MQIDIYANGVHVVCAQVLDHIAADAICRVIGADQYVCDGGRVVEVC